MVNCLEHQQTFIDLASEEKIKRSSPPQPTRVGEKLLIARYSVDHCKCGVSHLGGSVSILFHAKWTPSLADSAFHEALQRLAMDVLRVHMQLHKHVQSTIVVDARSVQVVDSPFREFGEFGKRVPDFGFDAISGFYIVLSNESPDLKDIVGDLGKNPKVRVHDAVAKTLVCGARFPLEARPASTLSRARS
jgi:hypothetical protein